MPNDHTFIERTLEEANARMYPTETPNVYGFRDAIRAGFDSMVGRKTVAMPTLGLGDAIGGIRDDDFVVVTARGGTGKTWLMLDMAYDLASTGKKIAFFSGEMSVEDIGETRLSKLDAATRNVTNLYTKERIEEALRGVKEVPLIFPELTRRWPFRTACMPLMDKMREEGCVMFFFDHLRYFMNRQEGKYQDERQMLENTVTDMRLYAKTHRTPIVLAVQPKQMASDEETTIDTLKGSSAISQEATVAIVLDRPRKKAEKGKPLDDSDSVFEPWVNVKVEKARHGRGNVKVKAYLHADVGRFLEWDRGGYDEWNRWATLKKPLA
jgi:replicative DNA helicase